MKKFLALIILVLIPGFRIFGQNSSYPYSNDINTRLMEAASYGDYPTVYDCLKKGADVNTATWDNVTPLMYAVSSGNKLIVKLLLDKGAKVNVQPMNGYSALITAAKYGFTEIAEMLIADSAAVNLQDSYRATALHYASVYNHDTIVFDLLGAGANPNIMSYDSISPLAMAAINGSYESAYQLVSAGGNVNSRDKNGFTPLMLAAQNGYISVVDLLLNNDANVNNQNKEGLSALSLAILNKHEDIVNLLLENGANASESNSLSLTPTTLAKLSKDSAIIDAIKRAKGKKNFIPAFNNLGAGLDFNFNAQDFITGFYLTQTDIKYKLTYNVGFAFRPSSITLLKPIPKFGYYQFKERRYYFNFDLTKGFGFNMGNGAQLNLNVGGRVLYSFGRYKATNIQVDGGITIAPMAGISFRKNNLEGRLGYFYSNFGAAELNKSHYSIGFVYYFKNFNSHNYNRRIKWIE